ncbi:hypothetical protein ACI4B7_27805, partial [Klebsiella pneumoniae]|uniref:hypothetical protein n=1 Tax=Klebsiella pneumoniae TaxID=573 RepID=UPI003852A2A5
RSVYKINFSIPSSKISRVTRDTKVKNFTANIVDEELINHFPDLQLIPIGQELYKFNEEREYYTDIQNSMFGITTKRSGWDCLRHY